MLTRRILLRAALAAAAALSVAPLRAANALSPEQARQFMNETAQKLVRVIDSPDPQPTKNEQMQEIIDRDVAVELIARFCLGRFWRTASPPQQQEYVRLFHHVLLNSITGHLGDYKGLTYTLGRPAPGQGGIEVPSVVNRPGQPAANLTWVISDIDGGPKIIDLIAEGTSLRVTQRSDYASFLNQHGGKVEALIGALKQQASRGG